MATSVGSGTYLVKDGDTTYGRSEYYVDWSASTNGTSLTFSVQVTGDEVSTQGTYKHYLGEVIIYIGDSEYVLYSEDSGNGLGNNSDKRTIDCGSITTRLAKENEEVYLYTYTYLNQGGSTIDGHAESLSLSADAYEPTSFTLTLSKGTGVSSTTGSGSYKKGTLVNINATISNGYTWNKWTGNTSYLNSSTTTKSNSITMPSSNITLTANATANTYKVNWNAQGGSASLTSSNIQFNSTYTLPTATKKGYTLKGWYTATSGGTKITTSTKHTVAGDVTYYAQWTPITYTIVFNANGGSGTMSNMSCTYDQSYNLTKNIFTKENYTFTGWATSTSGKVIYQDGESIENLLSTSGSITLYAIWIEEGIAYIYYNNNYQKAQVYIFDDGFWRLTQPYSYNNGWKTCSG